MQHPVLNDVILTRGGGGWPAIVSTAKTCHTFTTAVVKWIVLCPEFGRMPFQTWPGRIFFFFHNQVRNG